VKTLQQIQKTVRQLLQQSPHKASPIAIKLSRDLCRPHNWMPHQRLKSFVGRDRHMLLKRSSFALPTSVTQNEYFFYCDNNELETRPARWITLMNAVHPFMAAALSVRDFSIERWFIERTGSIFATRNRQKRRNVASWSAKRIMKSTETTRRSDTTGCSIPPVIQSY
jgi:hypothetical protein